MDQHRRKNAWGVNLLVLGLLLVILNPISGALAQDEFEARNVWFWVQVSTAALIFLVGRVESARARALQLAAESRELEARVATRVALADLLDPMANLLGEIARAEDQDRQAMCSEAVQVSLAAAASFVGHDRSRAGWYEIVDGPPRALTLERSVGRSGGTHSVFVAGTEFGDAVLDLVDTDDSVLWPDVVADPPPGWDPQQERDFRSFMAVSVYADATPYGMLTLDAPEARAFSEEDLLTLRLLAKLLAAALAQR
jgi:GAF domain-containing protein